MSLLGRKAAYVGSVKVRGKGVNASQRARAEGWGGAAIVVLATVLMKVASPSVLRSIVFVAAILAATWLIIRSTFVPR